MDTMNMGQKAIGEGLRRDMQAEQGALGSDVKVMSNKLKVISSGIWAETRAWKAK